MLTTMVDALLDRKRKTFAAIVVFFLTIMVDSLLDSKRIHSFVLEGGPQTNSSSLQTKVYL